jgi:predicted RNA-binding Zn-ribbon protein involved in translation (DUF1610 family)
VDLKLRSEIGLGYTSRSQISRVVTEKWFEENLFCPACPSNVLEQTPPNEKVVDFVCPKCSERYQMKALGHRFSTKVVDSAYEPKMQMIYDGTIPNFVFLQYDPSDYVVNDLLVVPRHFVTPEIIEKRKPLSSAARRAGWVGSNVLIGLLPPDARIYLVRDGGIVDPAEVRRVWDNFRFLSEKKLETRGWLSDVLACVRKIGKPDFSLQEVYGFERHLSEMHPDNRHVRDKIRQQLQFLRDEGVLEFTSPGRYVMKR